MTRTWVNWKPFLAHFIPYPDARLPLKRQTLIPEPMSYRLLLFYRSFRPVVGIDDSSRKDNRQDDGQRGVSDN